MEKRNTTNFSKLQIQCFIRWAHSETQSNATAQGSVKTIVDLADALMWSIVIEKLAGRVNAAKPSSKSDWKTTLDFARDSGVRIVGLSAQQLAGAEEIAVLTFAWAVIRHFVLPGSNSKINYRPMLFSWCNEILKKYNAPELKNLTSSLQDGKVLSYILHTVDSAAVELSSLPKSSPDSNLSLSLNGLSQRLQIPKILEVEEIRTQLDEKCMALYLSLVYNRLNPSSQKTRLTSNPESVRAAIDELITYRMKFTSLMDDIATIQKRHTILERENEVLKQDLSEAKEKAKKSESSQAQQTASSKKVEELTALIAEKDEDILALNLNMKGLQEANSMLASENEELNTKVKSLQDLNKKLAAEKNESDSRYRNLQEENELLVAENEALNLNKKSVQEMSKKFASESEASISNIRQMQEINQRLASENDSLNASIKQTQETNKKLSADFEDANLKLRQLQESNNILVKERESLLAENENLQDTLAEQKSASEIQASSIRMMQDSHSAELQELEDELKSLKAEHAKKIEYLSRHESSKSEHEQENKELSNQVQSLTNRIESLESDLEQQKSHAEAELQNLRDGYETRVSQMKSEISQLKRKSTQDSQSGIKLLLESQEETERLRKELEKIQKGREQDLNEFRSKMALVVESLEKFRLENDRMRLTITELISTPRQASRLSHSSDYDNSPVARPKKSSSERKPEREARLPSDTGDGAEDHEVFTPGSSPPIQYFARQTSPRDSFTSGSGGNRWRHSWSATKNA